MTDVLWAAWDGRGLEHLRLSVTGDAVRADSLILAVDEHARPFRARYVVECDGAWRVRRARIEVLEEPERVLDLQTDGQGRWTTGDDAATGLDGCLDVDIYPSPFTNTLPMRRVTDALVGRPFTIAVAWVALPELTVHAERQEYTLLERARDGARWRFRALDTGFTAELPTDGEGVVRDYPEIARRIL